MSAISKLINTLIIFWNLRMSYQMFLSQQVKQNVVITSENSKYKLTDQFPNDVRLKKISEIHGINV